MPAMAMQISASTTGPKPKRISVPMYAAQISVSSTAPIIEARRTSGPGRISAHWSLLQDHVLRAKCFKPCQPRDSRPRTCAVCMLMRNTGVRGLVFVFIYVLFQSLRGLKRKTKHTDNWSLRFGWSTCSHAMPL